jgi:hypothetical protein
MVFKPLTPKVILTAQRCLTRFLLGFFFSNLHFVNICLKNQQITPIIQFINYV